MDVEPVTRPERLMLPDHVIEKEGGHAKILERSSGRAISVSLPAEPRIRRRTSSAGLLAALASGVLALYFSLMFLVGLFTWAWEIAVIPLIMLVPFVVGLAFRGRIAVLSYLSAFIIFSIARGGMAAGQVKLGVIFFGDGPLSYHGYEIVPASGLLAALFVGIIPYVIYTMLRQVSAEFSVTIPSVEGDYSIALRDPGMVSETASFLGSKK